MPTRILTGPNKRQSHRNALARFQKQATRSLPSESMKFEILEPRVLLSATLDTGGVVVQGTDAADSIVVQVDPTDESLIQVQVNNEVTTHPIEEVNRIRINAGAGDDTISVDLPESLAEIHSIVLGGDGNDQITTSNGRDFVFGGQGDDQIDTGNGKDRVVGGEGDDQINGGAGNDGLFGGSGDDTINGNAGDDRLIGGDGDDVIDGGEGADRIADRQGENTIAEDDSDTIVNSSFDTTDRTHQRFGTWRGPRAWGLSG